MKKKTFDLFFDYKQGNLTPRSMVILFSQMLLGSKTMDTLIKHMHTSRTLSQVQDFKIISIIIKCNHYNDTVSHCRHHKHHKTLPLFHRAIAITQDEMSNIKRLQISFLNICYQFFKTFCITKRVLLFPAKYVRFTFLLFNFLWMQSFYKVIRMHFIHSNVISELFCFERLL